MLTIETNLSIGTKNKKLSKMGFADYHVITFQCSKTTQAQKISSTWTYAHQYEKELNKQQQQNDELKENVVVVDNNNESQQKRRVIVFLDEIGLAEHSPHRPLKVLHKLLENPDIAFIGLSNWGLDAAKMNRVILHRVLPPNKTDLKDTAEAIIKFVPNNQNNDKLPPWITRQLIPNIPKITSIYEDIMRDKKNYPFTFSFHGDRDFYGLINYFKFSIKLQNQNSKRRRIRSFNLSINNYEIKNDDGDKDENNGFGHYRNISSVSEGLNVTDLILAEATMRNFGGASKQQSDFFLQKIKAQLPCIKNLTDQQLWQKFNPLSLIKQNIIQTNKGIDNLRNIMLITDSSLMWKILFDSNILNISDTDVIFGSRFKNDTQSTIYIYRTIERIRNAMSCGRKCVLLKLDKLYESLYSVLNQRYINVDGQKFCDIFLGQEKIPCILHSKFRAIVVTSKKEAHHELQNNKNNNTPIAFLSRFEKHYIDPNTLEQFGVGKFWKTKWENLKHILKERFDLFDVYEKQDLFIGKLGNETYISALIAEQQCKQYFTTYPKDQINKIANALQISSSSTSSDNNQEEEKEENILKISRSINNVYHMLLRTCSIEYLLKDKKDKRTFVVNNNTFQDELIKDFIPYDSIIDLLNREGIKSLYKQNNNNDKTTKRCMLLRVVTHDAYQTAQDFNHRDDDINNNKNFGMIVLDKKEFKNEEIFDNDNNYEYDFEEDNKIHKTRIRDISEFLSESEFYGFICDFLTKDLISTTLILSCEPAKTVEDKTHYLHAQYLIEKARSDCFDDDKKSKLKNIVFLIYMSRNDPYPLIFNGEWKHLFLDSILPSNHKLYPQIQINDINVFDKKGNDQNKFTQRVSKHTDKIVFDSFEKAMNFVNISNLSDETRKEIEKIKNLLEVDKNDNQFKHILVDRIKEVLKSGAINCLITTLSYDKKRNDRGSIRSHVMEQLSNTIITQLIEILTIIFSNGNCKLYTNELVDNKLKIIWCQLLKDTQILKSNHQSFRSINMKKQKYGQQIKITTDTSLKSASFPFSANIHLFLSSWRKEIVDNYSKNSNILIGKAGKIGQIKLYNDMKEKWVEIQKAFQSPLDGLREKLVRLYLKDMILLESNKLGLSRYSHNEPIFNNLIEFVIEFIMKSSNDVKKQFAEPQQNQLTEAFSIDPIGSLYDDSDDDDGFINDDDDDDDDGKDDEKGIEMVKIENKEEDDEKIEKNEQVKTVQIYELYCSLWSNEYIICSFINVLSILKGSAAKLKEILNIEQEIRKRDTAKTLAIWLCDIMCDLVDYLPNTLKITDSAKSKQHITHLRSIQPSIGNCLKYFDDNRLYLNINRLNEFKKQWSLIKLSVLALSTCNDTSGEVVSSIEKQYDSLKYDNYEALGVLLYFVAKGISDDDNDKLAKLQWFFQNYIKFFAFNEANNVEPRFVDQLVKIMTNEDEMKNFYDNYEFEWDNFTKFEVITQILKLKQNAVLEKALEDENDIQSEFSLLVLNAFEQLLYNQYVKNKIDIFGKEAPKQEILEKVAKNFNDSLGGTKLDQLSAIAECKFILQQFIRYLSIIIVKSSKYNISEKGIRSVKTNKIINSPKYLEIIGKILSIPLYDEQHSQHMKNVKRGLQYFFASQIWHSVGQQQAIKTLKMSVFTKLMGLNQDLFQSNDANSQRHIDDNIPNDDIFKLCHNKQIYEKYSRAISNNNNQQLRVDTFHHSHFIHLIAYLFEHYFLNSNTNKQQQQQKQYNTTNTINFIHAISQKNVFIPKKRRRMNVSHKKTDPRIRLESVLSCLMTNKSESRFFRFESRLKHLQMLRLIWHFTAVILSVGVNPFSNLFHEPIRCFDKFYLMGMPEDQSSQLFKALAGYGVWLCPNDHLYFVDQCTATQESGNCPSCGAAIGQEVNTSRPHHPALGNKRIGSIDKNGKIVADNVHSSAVYGMANYDAAKLSPKGYVYIQGKDTECRDLDDISVRIIRWMVNAIIAIHHSNYSQSQAIQFTKIIKQNNDNNNNQEEKIQDNNNNNNSKNNNNVNDELMRQLFELLKKYTNELSNLLELNFQDTTYVLHAIIDKFYQEFNKNYENGLTKPFDNPQDRRKFERFLMDECINPIIKDNGIQNAINNIHQKCSSSEIVRDWSKKINQKIDLNSDDGKEFSQTHLPNLFQPFKPVSLRKFFDSMKTQAIQLNIDHFINIFKSTINTLYPDIDIKPYEHILRKEKLMSNIFKNKDDEKSSMNRDEFISLFKSIQTFNKEKMSIIYDTLESKNISYNVMKDKYPIMSGLYETLTSSSGYSLFSLKHLPSMINWIRLIHSKLNRRLNKDEIENDVDVYNCRWVLNQIEKDKWGDPSIWYNAFQGFVKGWNDLAERVTTTRDKVDVKMIDDQNENIEIDDNQNEQKEKPPINRTVSLIKSQQEFFKTYVAIRNECQLLHIPIIGGGVGVGGVIKNKQKNKKNSKQSKVKEPDKKQILNQMAGNISLIYSLNSNQADTSMIRHVLDHYIRINNKALQNCYKLKDLPPPKSKNIEKKQYEPFDENEEKKQIEQKQIEDYYDGDRKNYGNKEGLTPHLRAGDISTGKDVVDINVEEFITILQECSTRTNDCRYSYNLLLLETRLRETYIIGRRFIQQFDDIIFEFAGQFDTTQVIEKINFRFKKSFFNPASPELLKTVKLRIDTNACLGMRNDEKYDDNDRENAHIAERKLDLYKNALLAVEQSITALERQQTLNIQTQEIKISQFMRQTLRLYPHEYESFERSNLELKHLECIWRYLDRLYILQKGNWRGIPDCVMDIYQNNIKDGNIKTSLEQFISRFDLQPLWQFLRSFRRFLQRVCKSKISHADTLGLYLYLENIADIEQDLIEYFPKEIMLNQAGYAYKYCAEKYQARCNRENVKEATERREMP